MAKNDQKIGPLHIDFVLEDYVLYNLVRLSATYSAEMDNALKRHGLNTTKWRILSLLKDKNPSTVGELARRSVIKLPTITRMLDRMEQEGLITRRASDYDGRVVEISMTEQADVVLQQVRTIGQNVFEQAFANVSPGDIDHMTQTLKLIRENLNRSPYAAGMPAVADNEALTKTGAA